MVVGEEEALPQHAPFSQQVLLLLFSMLLCLQEDEESCLAVRLLSHSALLLRSVATPQKQ